MTQHETVLIHLYLVWSVWVTSSVLALSVPCIGFEPQLLYF